MLRFLTFLTAMLIMSAGIAQSVDPAWQKRDDAVARKLILLEKDLSAWEAEAAAKEPKSFEDVLLWLNLALRMHNTEHACLAADMLAEDFAEDFLKERDLNTYVLIAYNWDNYEAARHFFEKCPHKARYVPSGLFQDAAFHLSRMSYNDPNDGSRKSMERKIMTVESWPEARRSAWLKARWEDAKSYAKPCTKNDFFYRPGYNDPRLPLWLDTWHDFQKMSGVSDPALEAEIQAEMTRIAQDAREKKDFPLTYTYLQLVRKYSLGERLPDLTWVTDEETFSKLQWQKIADLFADMNLPELQKKAAALAAATPLTDEEIYLLRSTNSLGVVPEPYREEAGDRFGKRPDSDILFSFPCLISTAKEDENARNVPIEAEKQQAQKREAFLEFRSAIHQKNFLRAEEIYFQTLIPERSSLEYLHDRSEFHGDKDVAARTLKRIRNLEQKPWK